MIKDRTAALMDQALNVVLNCFAALFFFFQIFSYFVGIFFFFNLSYVSLYAVQGFNTNLLINSSEL